MNKLFSVKAFVFDEDKEQTVTIVNGRGQVVGTIRYYIRRLALIKNNLTFKDAKRIRNENSSFGASIFPSIKEEELKVVQLG